MPFPLPPPPPSIPLSFPLTQHFAFLSMWHHRFSVVKFWPVGSSFASGMEYICRLDSLISRPFSLSFLSLERMSLLTDYVHASHPFSSLFLPQSLLWKDTSPTRNHFLITLSGIRSYSEREREREGGKKRVVRRPISLCRPWHNVIRGGMGRGEREGRGGGEGRSVGMIIRSAEKAIDAIVSLISPSLS